MTKPKKHFDPTKFYVVHPSAIEDHLDDVWHIPRMFMPISHLPSYENAGLMTWFCDQGIDITSDRHPILLSLDLIEDAIIGIQLGVIKTKSNAPLNALEAVRQELLTTPPDHDQVCVMFTRRISWTNPYGRQ